MILAALTWAFVSGASSLLLGANEPNEEQALKATAERFIEGIDNNDAEALKSLLHPQMLQYTQLGDQLIPFKGEDFIQMVADKKLGGVKRSIKHEGAAVLRGRTASAVVNAVSEEYDFMYQLSMVKSEGQWVIVGILVDIQKAG